MDFLIVDIEIATVEKGEFEEIKVVCVPEIPSIKIPKKKHVRKWEKTFSKKFYGRDTSPKKWHDFSFNRLACQKWGDVIREVKEHNERKWSEVEE